MSSIAQFNNHYRAYILYFCYEIQKDKTIHAIEPFSLICNVLFEGINKPIKIINWKLPYSHPTSDDLLSYDFVTVTEFYQYAYIIPKQIKSTQFVQLSEEEIKKVLSYSDISFHGSYIFNKSSNKTQVIRNNHNDVLYTTNLIETIQNLNGFSATEGPYVTLSVTATNGLLSVGNGHIVSAASTDVTSKLLTGLPNLIGNITAADTILQAISKLIDNQKNFMTNKGGYIFGDMHLLSMTQSTTIGNAALVCEGGAQIKKDLHVGGFITSNQNPIVVCRDILTDMRVLTSSFIEEQKIIDDILIEPRSSIGFTIKICLCFRISLTENTNVIFRCKVNENDVLVCEFKNQESVINEIMQYEVTLQLHESNNQLSSNARLFFVNNPVKLFANNIDAIWLRDVINTISLTGQFSDNNIFCEIQTLDVWSSS